MIESLLEQLRKNFDDYTELKLAYPNTLPSFFYDTVNTDIQVNIPTQINNLFKLLNLVKQDNEFNVSIVEVLILSEMLRQKKEEIESRIELSKTVNDPIGITANGHVKIYELIQLVLRKISVSASSASETLDIAKLKEGH